MKRVYKPIACGLYDELEHRALKKCMVTLVFKEENGNINNISCIISDIISKDSAEFIKTEDGLLIRLDDIIEVDGIRCDKSC